MVTDGRRYKILGAVGRGGFGTVYRAELTGEGGFSKIVALKVLNPEMEEVGEMAIRLRDEARVLGLLRHRAIVQVDGLVRLSGRWTVVMEYVEGADLKQVLGAAGRIPLTAALTILEEVAGGLHVAYTRLGPEGRPLQLLHRDIKPSNIQITAAGETKLLDFGVARAEFAGREAETRSLMFGSVGYMSPERLDFVDGPAGDVYALGSVLYEMLAGVAFGKTSSKEARHEVRLAAGIEELRNLDVPEPVVELVAEMMAYEPTARPVVRDVERRAGRLRAEIAGPTLRDWAEDHVSPVLRERKDLPDELSGCTLVEQGSTAGAADRAADEPVPVPMRTPPRPATGDSEARTGSSARTVGAVAAVGGVGLVGLACLLLAAVGVAWFTLRPAEIPPAQPLPEVAAVPTTAAPPVEALVGGDVPSAPVEEPAAAAAMAAPRKKDPPKASAATASPVASAPAQVAAPEPAAHDAGSARVLVTGDARSVELVTGGKRHPTGDVPAGAYTVEAAFGEGGPIVAGKVQLVGGTTVTLRCDAVFARCGVR